MSKTLGIATATSLAILIGNGLYVAYISPTHFSPLYCWGGLLIGPIWRMWAEFLFLAAIGLFVFGLFASRMLAFAGALLMGLVSSAPEFARILTLGGACK